MVTPFVLIRSLVAEKRMAAMGALPESQDLATIWHKPPVGGRPHCGHNDERYLSSESRTDTSEGVCEHAYA